MAEYILTGEQAGKFLTNIWENGSKYWIRGTNISTYDQGEDIPLENTFKIENEIVNIEASVSFETNKRIDKAKINFPDNLTLKKTLEKLTGVALN